MCNAIIQYIRNLKNKQRCLFHSQQFSSGKVYGFWILEYFNKVKILTLKQMGSYSFEYI